MQLSRAIVSALLAATAVVSSPVSESVQIIEVRKKKYPIILPLEENSVTNTVRPRNG